MMDTLGDQIEAWLQDHTVTRCPTAAVGVTTATIPPEDARWLHGLPEPQKAKGRKKKPLSLVEFEKTMAAQYRRLGWRLRPAEISLEGERFGHLEVLSQATSNKGTVWLCRCDCGKEKEVLGYDLRRGRTMSCGCRRGQRRALWDLEGQRFGTVTVLSPVPRPAGNRDRDRYWNCRCDCGRAWPIRTSSLRRYFKTKDRCWCPGQPRK